MKPIDALKELILRHRTRHDLSQVEFADVCGLSVASIRNIEQGRMDQLPKLDTLSKIAQGLGEDPVSLLARLSGQSLPMTSGPVKGRVLIVDDEPDITHSYVLSVERLGYAATGVSSGQLALSAFSYCPPDVVLLDLSMPGMSGLEVARQLRKEFDFAGKIFIVTAFSPDARDLTAAGVDRVFLKNDPDFSIRRIASYF